MFFINRKFDLIALGELLIDFNMDGKSQQGNNVFEACPGGAPCNLLAMMRKLDKRVAFIGKVGNDQFGHLLKDTIDSIGIDSSQLKQDEEVNTTLTFVHKLPDGDREFSFYRNPGADMMLSADDVDCDFIAQGKIFHFGTLSMTHEGVRNATIKAIQAAKFSNCIISFDPNLRPPLWENMDIARKQFEYGLSNCDVLKIADNEIQFITGQDDFDKGIEILKKKYSNIKLICLTLGKDGSRAYYKDKCVTRSGFVQKDVVDTTGAGDTFGGCVLSFIADRGLDNLSTSELEDMITFANAAASLITTKKGAIKSMPEKSDVINLINRANKDC